MKIIEGTTKEVILNDNDLLLVSTLKGNKRKICITAKNGILEIDEVPINKIDFLREEEKAIKAMKEYKKENSNK